MNEHVAPSWAHAFMRLSPLLALYAGFNLAFGSNVVEIGDGSRYLQYSANLISGSYTDPSDPSLRNGPGYPLFLMPFVAWDAPIALIKFANALLLFLAMVFFYKLLCGYVGSRYALVWTYVLGMTPVMFMDTAGVMSEALAVLLVCAFSYFLVRYVRSTHIAFGSWLGASVCLGLAILTKVILSYAVLVCIGVMLLALLLGRHRVAMRFIGAAALAFVICAPYLIYTYSITGAPFLWGTQSGEILYWRSSPAEREFGNWVKYEEVLQDGGTDSMSFAEMYYDHGAVLKGMAGMSHVERDREFKRLALDNMRAYPLSYARKTLASGLRLLVNSPNSYRFQSLRLGLYLPNVIFAAGFVVCVIVALARMKWVPTEIIAFAILAMALAAGFTLLNGRGRHFALLLPFVFVVMAYVFHHLMAFKIKHPDALGPARP